MFARMSPRLAVIRAFVRTRSTPSAFDVARVRWSTGRITRRSRPGVAARGGGETGAGGKAGPRVRRISVMARTGIDFPIFLLSSVREDGQGEKKSDEKSNELHRGRNWCSRVKVNLSVGGCVRVYDKQTTGR